MAPCSALGAFGAGAVAIAGQVHRNSPYSMQVQGVECLDVDPSLKA
eukprot:CAMPEP_0117673712 /NCGR_PEP_ID=MMETSP0804-20121206/14624_1 /TAXON_ID=1074897 /ORGANISM="Tetraselmis astigmatica, Strain CCMP880" /LENGTH=45 /DNA_ID= /DNA_START= /DNA_END= /DNA_ORIENTATION=